MKFATVCLSVLLSAAQLGAAIRPGHTHVEQLKREAEEIEAANLQSLTKRANINPALLYPPHNISVPIDHFQTDSRYAPHLNGTFEMRYYFDASHYKAGGPVIILHGGETSATGRLSFLQKGMLAQLVNETNGIGVVLEHRYYGTSFPTPDLSVENLRFLTTEQALADVAYFAKNIKFPGVDGDLTAPNTPYIVYGGSYAGGLAAFLRITYPDLFWGTISSSGVTVAIWDYWQYYNIVAEFGPRLCLSVTEKLTNVVDNILFKQQSSIPQLKAAFNLANLTHNDDFASVLASGLGWWQSRNWDPAVGYPNFDYYCGNMSSTKILYPATEALRSTAQKLLQVGGWGAQSNQLTNHLLNYIGYVNLTQAAPCAASGSSPDECFSIYNPSYWGDESLSSYSSRSWTWQYCTEWGYLQTGSGFPKNQLPPISRAIDLDYNMLGCKIMFNITGPPEIERINKYGGYNIKYDRLAFIDGEVDPWRPAGVHADWAPRRRNTITRPFVEIEDAVHHWDENGLFPNETTSELPPKPVKEAQAYERKFVKAWLEDWAEEKGHKHHN